MSGYLGARQLAYNAGAASRRPDLGTMFSLYGRGVQGGASNSQIRHAQAAKEASQQEQWAHDAEVSQEHFRQQQALTSQRNPNAIPSSPEELAAYLDRKRQVAAITGKTFDQQKELLDLKQRFSKELIGERGDQSVRVEGVRQAGRSALEDQKQGGRVELQGNKIDADVEKQKRDIAYKVDALQRTLADKALSREEKVAYGKQLIELRKQAQALGERKQGFFEFLKPLEEKGRNDRASAAQAGATTRTSMNNDAAMQRTQAQQAGANQRSAASLDQRSKALEAQLADKSLDRATKVQIAQELIAVRRSIAEMQDKTKRDINDQNEQGRNYRSDSSQQGATTRTGMNIDAATERQRAMLQQRNDALNAHLADRNLTREQRAQLQQEAESIRLQITDMNNKARASEGDKNRLTGVYKQSVQNEFQGKENEASRKTRVWIDSSNRASREIENNKKREFSAGQQEDRQQENRAQQFFRSWFGASENQKKRDFQAEQTGKRQDFLSSEYEKNRAASAARSATNLNVRITQAAARNAGNPNAKFIVSEAQKAGEIELMQAHARNASPQEIDAITEKYAQEVERALNRR